MTPIELSRKLHININTTYLPGGAEFENRRYIYRELRDIPDLRVSYFADACLKEAGYKVFHFFEDTLFSIGFVFLPDRLACPALINLIDNFADRFGFSVTGAPSERRIKYADQVVEVAARRTEKGIIVFSFDQR
jgi:hypothetical protein